MMKKRQGIRGRALTWLVAGAVIVCGMTLRAQPVETQVTFETVVQQARERAGKPFRTPKADGPEEITKLNYDSYREIRFRHDKALWAQDALPFRLELFHPGYLYQVPVKLHEFNATHAQPIRFAEDFFDYGKLELKRKMPRDAGYAGFRLLYPVNAEGTWDEIASFLGASYFRMLGKGQSYGTSARGLAINSGESGIAEEFPLFTEWWIAKPEKGVNTLRLYGLLESVSCAGAYEFLVKPGETTFGDVSAVLFMRDPGVAQSEGTNRAEIKTWGIAPLTSMFWFGENSEGKPDDYRAEVHDSDGLLIRSKDDQFTWRPLNNPAAVRHQTFALQDPRGFGLLQRDREFRNFQDIFNPYHEVTSVWVEPRGNWGEGEVRLVELPTKFEGEDNIVAFWHPRKKPVPMEPLRFAYTLHWGARPDAKFTPMRIVQTRVGADPREPVKRQVSIDFDAGKDQRSESKPEVLVACGENGIIADQQVFWNEPGKSWRVIFSLTPRAGTQGDIDLSCHLKAGTNVVSEMWRYLWSPSLNAESQIARKR